MASTSISSLNETLFGVGVLPCVVLSWMTSGVANHRIADKRKGTGVSERLRIVVRLPGLTSKEENSILHAIFGQWGNDLGEKMVLQAMSGLCHAICASMVCSFGWVSLDLSLIYICSKAYSLCCILVLSHYLVVSKQPPILCLLRNSTLSFPNGVCVWAGQAIQSISVVTVFRTISPTFTIGASHISMSLISMNIPKSASSASH